MEFRNKLHSWQVVCFAVVVLGMALSPVVMAQSAGTSGLTGTVTDPSGATVPNVTVVVTSADTNQSRTATTGGDGNYRFTLLPPGIYKVRFSANGFKTAEVSAVTLTVTETPVLDRKLEVGAQSEQVTVEAAAETLQTSSSTLGTTVGTRTVTELPLASRNYTQIIGLSAGANVGVNNAVSFGKGTLDMSVNGNDPGQNNFQMDGVAINNVANRGSAGDFGIYAGIGIPSPDAIQEFKIQTSTYDASYGRNPGANVNVVTKSGTNTWHGTAFEFFRNAQLNANDFFYNRDNPNSRNGKQVLNQNQFGGVIGGPIKKDKLFIFGSYQGTRSRNGVAPQGNASGILLPLIPAGDRTSAAFIKQVIAQNCNFPTFGPPLSCSATSISPQSLAILQIKNTDGSYYIPSGGDGHTLTSYSIPAVRSEDQYIVNGDYLLNAKNTLAMRYFFSEGPQTVPFYPPFGGALPGAPQAGYYANNNASLRLTTIVTNAFVNEARASFQRNLAVLSDELPPGSSPAALGIKPISPNQTQAPPITFLINGFTAFGFLDPSFAPNNQFQYADQISWSHGRHTIRAGFEFEKTQYNLVFNGLPRGWMFMGSFSDLLVGGPGNILQTLFNVRSAPDGIVHGYRLPNMSSFVQDDWKVSSKLTVNIGVRWEYMGTLSDKYGNATNTWLSRLVPNSQVPTAPLKVAANYLGYVVPSNYDTKTYGPLPPGILQNSGTLATREHPPLSNFGPRIGFAYQATSKLVIRGGAGLFYDRVGLDRFFHSLEEGNPYAATISYGPGNTHTIADPYPATPVFGDYAQRWANLSDPTTSQGSAINHVFLTEVIHTPLVRQYNLNFQYEFAPRWVLETGFVGSSGINLTDYNHNYNTAGIATPNHPINGIQFTCGAFETVAPCSGSPAGNIDLRTPYLGFQAGGLQGSAFDGSSNYNSFQATVRKQFSHGFSMQGAYTWSKALTNIFNATANSNLSTDLAQQYGPANFNRPQRFVFNYSWDLPFGKRNGVVGKLLEGWNLSGVTTIQDGAPIGLIDTRGGSAYGTSTTTIEGGYSRPQLCPGVTYDQIASQGDIKQRLNGYWKSTAFCTPPAITPTGTLTTMAACPSCATLFGNIGVGVMLGPGQFNFDSSLLKTTRLGENRTLQFRAEFFNLFNHAQFNAPSQGLLGAQGTLANVASPTGGLITATSVNPRIIQLGLKFSF